MAKGVRSQVLPSSGQRVGTVSGPGQFPRDNAGTVICQITDRWGTHALVMMDSGRVDTCHGLNNGAGIGWHRIQQTTLNF
jgi:hypothetical protein